MKEGKRPQIAVVVHNTLAGLGLAGIIEKMMPGAEVCLFNDYADLTASGQTESFFHYFISSRVLLGNADFFLVRRHKTIVLVYGDETGQLPQNFHTLNICLSEELLVRDLLLLAGRSHGQGDARPEPVRRVSVSEATSLTPREVEVLRLIVSGLINKEIAARLKVELTTVISHRKNLTEKLGTKSVSALTIYAVTHGIVKAEEI